MQVSIEKVSSVERRLTIAVPQEQIMTAYHKQITHMANRTTLKGFRPGKVPLAVIEQRFGLEARKEALSQVIQDSLTQAMKTHALHPVNTPRVEPQTTENQQSFEFVASFEVLPEITAIHCQLETVDKPIVTVTDADVSEALEQLRKRHTPPQPSASPDSAEVPAWDEALIKRLGISSGLLEDLKKQIKQSLEQECYRLIQDKLKQQVFGHVFEKNPIEVPASMIAHEIQRIHTERHPHHEKNEPCQPTESERELFDTLAKKRVSLGLLISTYIQQQQLTVDQERLQQRVAEIASAYEDPEKVSQWLLSQKAYRTNLETQVLEESVLNKLLDGVKIKEIPMSYAELKNKESLL